MAFVKKKTLIEHIESRLKLSFHDDDDVDDEKKNAVILLTLRRRPS
jgi:hypothetical protein